MPMTIKPASENIKLELNQITPCAYLTEILQSEAPDGEEITAGFYKQTDGDALEFTYGFDEFKYIYEVEGEFLISDETSTKSVKVGDVVYIKKGTSMKFETRGGFAKVFFVAKKALGPPK